MDKQTALKILWESLNITVGAGDLHDIVTEPTKFGVAVIALGGGVDIFQNLEDRKALPKILRELADAIEGEE